jgi:hypothetical protein
LLWLAAAFRDAGSRTSRVAPLIPMASMIGPRAGQTATFLFDGKMGYALDHAVVCKWLNSGGVAEISHSGNCNFFSRPEFK